jgi:signal transduction histidine kinase
MAELVKNLLYIFLALFSCITTFAQPASQYQIITKEQGLPSNYVFNVTEDANGFLWAATDKGLCKFNGSTWQLWNIENGLASNYVTDLVADKKGGLWITLSGLKGGLAYFKDGKVSSCFVPNINKNLSENFIANDSLHITLTQNLKDSIRSYYEDNGKIKYITRALTKKEIEQNNICKENILPSIPEQKSNEAIIYSNAKFAISKNGFIGCNKIFIKTNKPICTKIASNNFAKFIEGKLYTNLNSNGFAVTDSQGRVSYESMTTGLSSNEINNIYYSKTGSIYVATLGGGINIKKPQAALSFYGVKKECRQIIVEGNLFYALQGSSIYINDAKGTIQNYILPREGLCMFKNGNSIYVGDFEGLHHYNINNGSLHLQASFTLRSGISSILLQNNNIIIGSYGSGILALQQNQLACLRNKDWPFSNIEKLFPIKDGIAALSYEDGFFITNNNFSSYQYFTKKNGLLSNHVKDIQYYRDTLFVATAAGIQQISNNKVVKQLGVAEGFVDDYPQQFLINNKNQLLIIGNENIFIYEAGKLIRTNNFGTNIKHNDKLKTVALFQDSMLLYATENHLQLVPTFKNSGNQLAISNIIKVTTNNLFIAANSEIVLPHDFKKISFYFSPTSDYILQENTIYTKLNDGDWQQLSDSLVISFTNLQPGKYNLYSKIVMPNGTITKEALQKTFTVKRIWWQQTPFVIIWLLLAGLGVWAVVSNINKQKYKKQLEAIKVQQQLEQERQRISRDLHDNMGAYTSALISNVQQLKSNIGDNEHTNKMQSNAESILNSLRETIWVLNSKEISLQNFNDGFKNYCFKVLRNFEDINFDAKEEIGENLLLTASQAIHLNKILQEAIQNCIKHAKATQIHYTIENKKGLYISIKDNGVGFTKSTSEGYGLENMKWRAKEAGIAINIKSEMNQGTLVEIKLQ